MKPRYKLNTNGTVTLIRAGLSGLTGPQTRLFMVRCSGSVQAHCVRFGLPIEGVRRALHGGDTYRFDTAGAMRVMLGLPMVPAAHVRCTDNKRGAQTAATFAALMDGHARHVYPELTERLGCAGRAAA
jgi:hypothetical protein